MIVDGNMYADISFLHFAKVSLEVLICDYNDLFLEIYFSCALLIFYYGMVLLAFFEEPLILIRLLIPALMNSVFFC